MDSRKINLFKIALILGISFFLSACSTTKSHKQSHDIKKPLWQDEPQIEVGKPNILIDSLGNIVSLPKKIILLNPKVDSHTFSEETKNTLESYVKVNPQMKDTKIRVNQFTPVGEFKRLIKNRKIKWWWRVFPGIPTTLFSLGGRIFGGDHYNPYTDTIHIYSDIGPVALHEAGHAVDTAEKVKEGWADYYILGRTLPIITLHQELVASEKAVHHLEDKKDKKEEDRAYRVLFPAYGTYAGGSTGIPYGDVAGAIVGHVVSIVPRYNTRLKYEAQESAKWASEPVYNLSEDPVNKSLFQDFERREKILNGTLQTEEIKNKD